MKLQRRWLAAAVSTAVVAASAFVLASSGVSAVGGVDPAITSDPNAANGSIAFFDAAGNRVYSGPLSSPFAAYAVASSATQKTGTIKATLFVATPDHTKANSLTWFNQQLTAASAYPLTGAPAAVAAAEGPNVPAVAVQPGDGDLAGAFASAVNDSTAGYDHIMQIRLEDSGIGVGKNAGPPFWASDVYIDTTAGTWTQVYPAAATKTSTAVSAITANPASPAAHGATVTLTATVTAGDSTHPAGSVHLFDGATDLGAATFDAATGAVTKTLAPADGTHSYTFKFTPSNTATYNASASAALSYAVSAATATATTLSAAPVSPSTVGDSVTFTATVSPAAAGSVQFKDGSSNLGAPVSISGGTAALTTAALTTGSHSITAGFTSTDPAFSGSTSNALSYKVNPAPATSTTTTLSVNPTGPVDYGTSVSLTATVAPSAAAGTVQFLDGTTLIGSPVTVSGGTAGASFANLASGPHSLTAKFTPSVPASYGASMSTATSLTVNPRTTSTTLAVSPAGPVDHGTAVTLKASVTPAAATGTVTFFDGTTAIGGPVTVTAGLAQTSTTNLPVSTHSLTAQFSPANAASFTTSTSAAVNLVVQNPPPGATTTTLSVNPAGPIVVGDSVTLKATVVPAAAAGSVQFLDGGTAVGAPVPVVNGVASTSDTPDLGTHNYTATFTSADQSTFKDSTAGAVSLVVKAPAAKTSTALTVSPAGPVAHGTPVTFSATVSPLTPGDPQPADGSISFRDGSVQLGTAAVGPSGTASLTTAALGGGVHSVQATYLPADATVFAASTSAPVTLTVQPEATVLTLSAAPAGKVSQGKAVTFTATLTPATATGTVAFSEAGTVLASIPVSSGKAVLVDRKLSVGDHSVTASFTPTDAAAFAGSTAGPLGLTVVAPPTVGTVTVGGTAVTPGSTLQAGELLTLTGSGFQPGEKVSVILQSAPGSLGTTTADRAGDVTVTVRLPRPLSAGTHTLVLRGSLADADADADFDFAIASPSGAGTPAPSGSSPAGSGTGSAAGTEPATGSGGSGLASTGAAIWPATGLGGLLLLVGAGLLFGARRRRTD